MEDENGVEKKWKDEEKVNSGCIYIHDQIFVLINYYFLIKHVPKWTIPEMPRNCLYNRRIGAVLGPILEKFSTRKL